MAVSETIQEILTGIDEAQYGRDMRQYIHKGIQKCYEEGSAGETDLTARTEISNINESIASVETSTTASKAYAVGDYMVIDGVLYCVTAAIAQGGTITENTNIEATTIESELSKVDDLYELPYTNANSTTNKSKLYVLPKQKILIFSINYAVTSTSGASQLIASALPEIVGVSDLLGTYVHYPLITVKDNGNATDFEHDSYGELKVSGSPKATKLYVTYKAQSYDRHVYGTIVAPYKDYDSNHPLSSATLIER